jgi:two-component system sensor histidine kinase QseC
VIARHGYSLTRRLLALFLASGAFLVGVLAVVTAFLAPSFSVLATLSSLEGAAEDLSESISVDSDGALVARSESRVEAWGYDALYQNIGYRIVEADTLKVLLESSAEPSALIRRIPADIALGATTLEDGGGLVLRTETDVAGRTVYVDVARSDQITDLALEAVLPAALETLLIATSTGFAFIVLYSFVLVWIVRKEMLDLTRRVAGIGPDAPGRRIAVGELPRELQPLASAFNEALERVDASVERERRFVANAAHELRTPLAVIRARLEELRPDTLLSQNLRTDTDYMTRVVSQLLDLAKVQSDGLAMSFPRDANPMEAARSILSMLAPIAVNRGVELSLEDDGHSSKRWSISQPALQILIRNLSENAIAACGHGGSVVVRLNWSQLSVSDSGPGIPIAARERIFDRFWRGDARSRTGAGLGLSIVAEIAHSAGAKVEVGDDPDLGGARFQIEFPAAGP